MHWGDRKRMVEADHPDVIKNKKNGILILECSTLST